MSLNPRLRDWQGRRAWIVGASSGIGLALAEALQARGATVIASARRAEALQALAARCPGVVAWPLDATDGEALARAAAQLQADGPLDLVCHCAGHYAASDAGTLDPEAWARHRAVNLDSAVALALAVLPAMRQAGRGHLSLVSSVAGFRGLPRSLAYGTTKAALTHFGEALHLELAPLGVGISVVAPGFVETPMTAANDFAMPALIRPPQAAEAMLAGWARGDFLIDFPRRFTRVLALLRCLPYAWYFPLVRAATRPR